MVPPSEPDGRVEIDGLAPPPKFICHAMGPGVSTPLGIGGGAFRAACTATGLYGVTRLLTMYALIDFLVPFERWIVVKKNVSFARSVPDGWVTSVTQPVTCEPTSAGCDVSTTRSLNLSPYFAVVE